MGCSCRTFREELLARAYVAEWGLSTFSLRESSRYPARGTLPKHARAGFSCR